MPGTCIPRPNGRLGSTSRQCRVSEPNSTSQFKHYHTTQPDCYDSHKSAFNCTSTALPERTTNQCAIPRDNNSHSPNHPPCIPQLPIHYHRNTSTDTATSNSLSLSETESHTIPTQHGSTHDKATQNKATQRKEGTAVKGTKPPTAQNVLRPRNAPLQRVRPDRPLPVVVVLGLFAHRARALVVPRDKSVGSGCEGAGGGGGVSCCCCWRLTLKLGGGWCECEWRGRW
jgi:hypothetical protein